MAGNARDEVIRYVYEVSGSKELKAVAEQLLEVGDVSEESAAGVKALAEEIGRINEATKATKSIIGLKASLQETGDKLALAKVGLSELNKEFGQSDRSSATVARAFRAAEKAVADLSKEEKALELQLLKANGVMAKHGLDVGNLAAADEKLRARSSGVAAALKQVGEESKRDGASTAELEGKTSSAGKTFESARGGVASFAAGLLKLTGIGAVVSAALAALSVGKLFGGATKSATTFEAALSEVRAVSGATADEMNRMRVAAEAASTSTKFSALEAVQAIGELARASGDATQAIDQLPAALNLAQAAGIGAVEAVGILATATTQFGLAAGDAARIADLFAREANSTQDSVTSLGLAMSYAAPLARQLGLGIEQTTALLGAMADQGFKGERAGTALRNVFSQLVDPTSKFREALNSLGIEGNDFGTIIDGLAKAGEKGKQALLTLDAAARPAIAALVTTGGEGIRRLTEDFKDAAGEAERTAKIMGANFEGASSRLGAAFDFMRRSLVTPILQPLAEQFDEVAIKIRAFAETAQFQQLAQSIKDFALSSTQAIIAFVGSVDFTALTQKARGLLVDMTEVFDKIKSAGEGISIAFRLLGNSISFLFNTIQTLVLASATQVVAAFWLMTEGAVKVARAMGAPEAAVRQLAAASKDLGDLTASLWGRMASNARETSDAAKGVVNALTDIGASAQAASEKVAPLSERLKLTTEQAVEAKRQFDALPPRLQALVEPGLRAAGVFEKLAEDSARASQQQEGAAKSIDQARAAAMAAYNEVARLSGAGDTTSEAFRRAKVALAAANDEVARLSGKSREAEAAATALSAAQSRLGQTQEQLAASAALAAADLDSIWKSYLAGTNQIEDVRASFQRYAEAQRASVANSAAWKKSTIESILAVKAAALGISDIKPPPLKPLDVSPLTKPLQQVSEGVQQVGDQAGKVGEKAKEGMTSAGAAIATIFAGWMNEFGKTSKAASDEFQKLNAQIFNLGAGVADGIGLVRFAEAVNQASRIVIASIDEQRAGVKALQDEWGGLSDDAIRGMAAAGGGVDRLAEGFDLLAGTVRDGRSQFSLLGQEDLGPLASAADAVAARVRKIGEEAANVRRELSDMADSFQDQIDQIEGNQAQSEQRRHERELERIKERAEAAGAANSSEYNDAVEAANRLHQLKLKQIREQEEAAKQADKARAESETARETSSQSSSARANSGAGSTQGGGMGPVIQHTYNYGLETATVTGPVRDGNQIAAWVQELQRARSLIGK